MNALATLSLLTLSVIGAAASAKDPNPIANFARDALAKSTPGMLAAGAAMPGEKFRLRGPPDDMTFGYLIWHIADGNYIYCAAIGAIAAPALTEVGENTPKEALLERMKASFDFCNTALSKLDDSHMNETLTMGETKMSRAMAILTLAGSWTTHDSQLDSYLKLGQGR